MVYDREFCIEKLIVCVDENAKHQLFLKTFIRRWSLTDSLSGFICLGNCVMGNLSWSGD